MPFMLSRPFPRGLGAIVLVLAATSASLLTPPTAGAETSAGLRGGLSIDPDQVLVGGHLNFSPVDDNLYIVPSAEAGFGDDLFTLSFNGDLQYRFRSRSELRWYAGGGLTLYYVDADPGGSDSELGVSFLGGFFFNRRSEHPMFVEAKIGLDNVPDWKFIFGVNF